MDETQVNWETNKLVVEAYKRLRQDNFSKTDFQEIEQFLSENIYESEKLIHGVRGQHDLENVYYRRRTLLKRIADGLAWEIFDYDIHVITACAIGHSTGFMFGNQSYPYERNIVEAVYKLPGVRSVIQCDITNFLRLADVLAVKEDGTIIPIEEKGRSSKENRRANRQKKRYKEMISFLNSGQEKPITVNGQSLRAIKSSQVFDHYWKDLEDLASTALNKGFSWRLLDDCVFLSVSDTQSRVSVEDYCYALQKVNWKDPCIIISSLGRHLQKNLDHIPITSLPLTIFPIPVDIGVEFLVGRLDSVVAVNLVEIVSKLCATGVKASILPGKRVQIEKEGVRFSPAEGAWSRILNEMVTIPCFISYILSSENLISSEYDTNGS